MSEPNEEVIFTILLQVDVSTLNERHHFNNIPFSTK
jgi:hypothetical protein